MGDSESRWVIQGRVGNITLRSQCHASSNQVETNMFASICQSIHLNPLFTLLHAGRSSVPMDVVTPE